MLEAEAVGSTCCLKPKAGQKGGPFFAYLFPWLLIARGGMGPDSRNQAEKPGVVKVQVWEPKAKKGDMCKTVQATVSHCKGTFRMQCRHKQKGNLRCDYGSVVPKGPLDQAKLCL